MSKSLKKSTITTSLDMSTHQTPLQVPFSYTGTYFVAPMSIGTPPQPVHLILDAGSCELGVSGAECTNCIASGATPGVFDKTKSTSFKMSDPVQNVQLCYGTGSACNNGYIGYDSVTLGGHAIPQVAMSIDTSITTPAVTSGIFGLCGNMAAYTKNKKQPATSVIPLLAKAAGLTKNVFAFEISNWTAELAASASSKKPVPGNLTVGGWNTAKYAKPTFFKNVGKGYFWQIGTLSAVNGIKLPTGTTQLLTIDSGAPGQNLPTYLNNNKAFLKTIPVKGSGAKCEFLTSTTIQCSCKSLKDINNLVYTFGSTSFTIPVSAYVTYKNSVCTTQLNYKDTDSKLGGPFFKSHYIVFDYDNNQVGFAPYSS